MIHHGHRPSHTLTLTLQRLKGGFYVIHAPVRVVGDGIDVTGTTDRYGVVRFVVVAPDPPPPRLSLFVAGKPAGAVAVNWVMPSTEQHVLV